MGDGALVEFAGVVDAVEYAVTIRNTVGARMTGSPAAPYPPVPPRITAAWEMFEAVIDMAPEFAGGYAGASAMTGCAALWGHRDPAAAAARAEELARRAISA